MKHGKTNQINFLISIIIAKKKPTASFKTQGPDKNLIISYCPYQSHGF